MLATRQSVHSLNNDVDEEMKVSLATLGDDSQDITLGDSSPSVYMPPTMSGSARTSDHVGLLLDEDEGSTAKNRETITTIVCDPRPAEPESASLIHQPATNRNSNMQPNTKPSTQIKYLPTLDTEDSLLGNHGGGNDSLRLMTASKSIEARYADEVLVTWNKSSASIEYSAGNSVLLPLTSTISNFGKTTLFLECLLKSNAIGGFLTRRELLMITPFKEITADDAVLIISTARTNISAAEEEERVTSTVAAGAGQTHNISKTVEVNNFSPINSPKESRGAHPPPNLPLKEGGASAADDVKLRRVIGYDDKGGIVLSDSSGDYCPPTAVSSSNHKAGLPTMVATTSTKTAKALPLAPYHPTIGPPVRLDTVMYPILRSLVAEPAINATKPPQPVLNVPTLSCTPDVLKVSADSYINETVKQPQQQQYQSLPSTRPPHANTGPIEWDPFFGPPIRLRIPASGSRVNMGDAANRRAWAETMARDLKQ